MVRKEAEYYIKEGQTVKCYLCPHFCTINNGATGLCGVRRNRNGVLYSENYGLVAAINLDPIEKKPLYHFHPGGKILSIGSLGCNLRCCFCQNSQISQPSIRDLGKYKRLSAEEMTDKAFLCEKNIGIAYTYNEPSIWFEFVKETAASITAKGMKNVMVTNGYINPGPLGELLLYMDAFNVDLKSFSNDFYSVYAGGRIKPVLENIRSISMSGKHLEITHLVVSGLNDKESEFTKMVDWIAGETGNNTVLHISRYFPAYRHNSPPTLISTLKKFIDIAGRKLNFVYSGNF